MRTTLTAEDHARIDRQLAATDASLAAVYPGDDGSRQPVHTVYVPADRFTPDLARDWGAQAFSSVEEGGGFESLAAAVGVAPDLIESVAARTAAKLAREPIEDLRLDFEDGYGDRGDAEDADVMRVSAQIVESIGTGLAPPFIGIRCKSFERATRARALRTLDLFIGSLIEAGGLPRGLVLTLPKVSTIAQVEAMADAAAALERAHRLPEGRIRFEVQVETPQLILGPGGTSPLAQLPIAVPGRISGLHYGTYDYSAALGIAAGYQSMEHPVADHAKAVMLLAVAGTGIRVSDGSTNILPIGARTMEAWQLHSRLVRRSLERGFYQGWDLHAHQLPTRYLATYAFFREGYQPAARRLQAYLDHAAGAVLDEPATARALAWFVLRGVQCGAVGADEVTADVGIDQAALALLAHPRRARAVDAAGT